MSEQNNRQQLQNEAVVKAYQKYYEQNSGIRKPEQSGFVSSTQWNSGDSKWYAAQTIHSSSPFITRPVQNHQVSSSENN